MNQKKFSFEWNGQKAEGYAQKIKGRLWVYYKGKTLAIENAPSRRRGGAGDGANSADSLTAPMPGRVTRVFVKSGETVDVGQPILVMEAMKMEYTLKSSFKTVVENVLIQEGDQVQLNQLLVKLEA